MQAEEGRISITGGGERIRITGGGGEDKNNKRRGGGIRIAGRGGEDKNKFLRKFMYSYSLMVLLSNSNFSKIVLHL